MSHHGRVTVAVCASVSLSVSWRAAPKLSRVSTVNSNHESGPLIRKAFDEFLRSLMGKARAQAHGRH